MARPRGRASRTARSRWTNGRRTAVASSVALTASLIQVHGAPPAAADQTWFCTRGTTEFFWSGWAAGSQDPKYNTSRFKHRHCLENGKAEAWQFVASETKASRGCGGTDKWRVRSQHFTNGTFKYDTPWSGYRFNDCTIVSHGEVASLGDMVAIIPISMQAKVEQRCELNSPLNCATFDAYVSKRITPD